MTIGGLQKFTLLDYPGKIAATIFVSGCNFRCPFCYNPELVLPEKIQEQPQIPLEEIYEFLEERKNLLEGVVLCGGEPTIHKDLPQLAKKIRNLGYSIKLDTNGSNPEMIKKMVEDDLLDYVAMDVKAPKKKYQQLAGRKIDVKKIGKSIKIIKESGIDYEFRTTVVPKLLDKNDILSIAKWISPAKKYVLQEFKASKNIDPKISQLKPYPKEYLTEIQRAIVPFFEICEIRA
ncbi:anaerobic ribonucleoside-triphosphate reductase activating protein [bacterium]|nr:anaerobic ribonucleoside-triphosphate reductase activating protein [bacterium]